MRNHKNNVIVQRLYCLNAKNLNNTSLAFGDKYVLDIVCNIHPKMSLVMSKLKN